MNVLEIKSIAKINLGLIVKEKRSDGFHNLQTIFYPISDLYDKLIFVKSEKNEFSSNTDLAFDETNLIRKAQTSLEKLTGENLSVKISLDKKIPQGGGLGGGSSNAAATLLALNRLFELSIAEKKLAEIALALGSDVPYFLYSKTAYAEGRGEKLTPINLKINGVIVLVNPRIHISTKEAFANINPPNPKNLDYEKISASVSDNFENARALITNDFEEYAISRFPVIGEIKSLAYSHGASFSAMTGTGSTVYSIFRDKISAENFAKTFSNKNFIIFMSVNHG